MPQGLRLATADDAAALLAIYEPYILHTNITFETEVPTVAAYARRIREIAARFPYLLWEVDGRVVGYAYAHRFKERAAFDWSAETSIYLAPEAQGTGAAQRLYGALTELMGAMHYAHLYGVITHPNPRSEAFHRAMGFSMLAELPNVGYKHGRWEGVAYYCLPLGPLPEHPPAIIPFPQLPEDLVQGILSRYSRD